MPVRDDLPPFPDSFRFGVATADHQCEAYLEGSDDVRDLWEKRRGEVPRGRATDFWNRFAEDVDLARKLGCTMFRFSLAWARLEPQPGNFDAAAFGHYREVLEAIRAAAMEPIVTLHHYTWPIHVEQAGGSTGDGFVASYVRYATECATRLGDLVNYWVTFNEPTQLVFGYVKPWWGRSYAMPPGLEQGATTEEQMSHVAVLMRHLFLAHTGARAAIKERNPAARVGTNPMLLGLPTWLQRFVDWQATRLRGRADLVAAGKSFTERRLLEHGAVDVAIAQLSATPERASHVAFSESYLATAQRAIVRRASANDTIASIAGGRIAVVDTSSSQALVDQQFPNATVVVMSDYEAAFHALDADEADALVADEAIARDFMQRGDYRMLDGSLSDDRYAAAVALGNRELLDVVDAAVRAFKASPAWETSWRRNFPHESTPKPPIEGRRSTLADLREGAKSSKSSQSGPWPPAKPGSVLARIQRRGYVNVAIRERVGGMANYDAATKTWSGFEVDLARLVSSVLFGSEEHVRFQPVHTQARLAILRSTSRAFTSLQRIYSVLTTMLNSNWWHLGMAGRLSPDFCPPECVGQQDYVGLDYYWGISALGLHRIARLLDAAGQRYSQAPVWPQVLYDTLVRYARMFPGKELLVIENGCVNAADGVSKADYIARHVREVQRAVAAGVPVTAYVCWSITSNREWGLPLDADSDFGLYHIDLDGDAELRRVATPAAEVYREIIAQRSAANLAPGP